MENFQPTHFIEVVRGANDKTYEMPLTDIKYLDSSLYVTREITRNLQTVAIIKIMFRHTTLNQSKI